MVRGYTQKEGINFTEMFSPVVKHSSIRIILVMVALLDMELEQMDVKTTFLHGNLEEQLLMKQSEGFDTRGRKTMFLYYISHYMDLNNLLDSGIEDLMSSC